MKSIVDQLTGGTLHAAARRRRPDCTDTKGNVHHTPERAQFVNWLIAAKVRYGDYVENWTDAQRAEYRRLYVPVC